MPSEVIRDQAIESQLELKKAHKKSKKDKKSSRKKDKKDSVTVEESEVPMTSTDQPAVEPQEPQEEGQNIKKKPRRGRRGGKGKSITDFEAPKDVLPSIDPNEHEDHQAQMDQQVEASQDLKPKTKRGKRKRKNADDQDDGQQEEYNAGQEPRNDQEYYSDQAVLPELDPETRSYFENVENVIDEKKFETEEGEIHI